MTREDRIHKAGLTTVLKGEANYEKQKQSSFVELVDNISGQKKHFKKPVADRLISKGSHNPTRLVFTVPELPWRILPQED